MDNNNQKSYYLCGLFYKAKVYQIVKDYKIQFSGLAEEVHEFSYVLEKPFFDLFEEEVIRDGRVEVLLTMDKQTRMLIFSFDISGEVDVICDRCADPLKLGIEGTEQLIVRIGGDSDSPDDDIVFIDDEAYEIDLTQHLFDYVHLLLPIQMTHDDSSDGKECDPEMLALLDRYSSEKKTDKRWEGLEGLVNPGEETNQ